MNFQQNEKAIRVLLLVAALILLPAILLKALTLLVAKGSLNGTNPLFPFLTQRTVTVFAIFLDAAVLGVLFLGPRETRFLPVVWLAALFLVYHGIVGLDHPCGCFGIWKTFSVISDPRIAVTLAAILLITSLAGAYFEKIRRSIPLVHMKNEQAGRSH